MPTYRVTGAHLDTGEPVQETFRAKDEADAKRYCNQQRIGIESLTLASKNGDPAAARPMNLTPPGMPPGRDADLAELLAAVRTQTALLDQTLNERSSPFFKHLESRTRMAVGVGIVIGAVLFAIIGIAFFIITGGAGS